MAIVEFTSFNTFHYSPKSCKDQGCVGNVDSWHWIGNSGQKIPLQKSDVDGVTTRFTIILFIASPPTMDLGINTGKVHRTQQHFLTFKLAL